MEVFVPMIHTGTEKADILVLQQWQQRDPMLHVGFSTRSGGVSEGIFKSQNCGLHVRDHTDHVIKNREKLAETVGFDFEAWTAAEQVHGNEVAIIEPGMRGRGRVSLEDTLTGVDAMVTCYTDIMLTAVFADCSPIFLYDPEHRAVGIGHAGWRGTAGRIAANMVEVMREQYGSRPEQLLAAVGPSIGKCCYEVDEQVICKMREVEGFTQSCTPKIEGKWQLDLKEMNRHIMIKAGILEEHIEISKWCTSCRTDMFYSHRKERGRTGRMAGWIGMKDRGE